MTETALQKLLFKRFLLGAGTYLLVLALAWVALVSGHVRVPASTLLAGSLMALASQGLLAWVFVTRRNLSSRDPSLTEAQVLIAVAWQCWLLANLDEARSLFLMIYPLILMFGLFHLSGQAFVRCAALMFGSFALLSLVEWRSGRAFDGPLVALQLCALFVVLAWLCLYARYVQASRLRMRQRRYALQAHQETLRGMMGQLEKLVATDELTGLFNRRHFLRLAGRELEALMPSVRHGLALIDLDHFKRINDAYGHGAGDQVLQAFAEVAAQCLNETAVLARYGGEEFVLLLPDCTAEQLQQCCEALRLAYAACRPAAVGEKVLPLRLSAGMTLLTEGDDLDAALHRADQALYRAKRSGRDRCLAAWETVDA